MRIEICGSMASCNEMMKIKERLSELGHLAIVPPFIEQYLNLNSSEEIRNEAFENKTKHDIINVYFKKIKKCDAVLVVNIMKDGIPNYIGGNAFLEMGFAHVLGKKIFLLNPIPNARYKDEIIAMQPIIINGDLSKIR